MPNGCHGQPCTSLWRHECCKETCVSGAFASVAWSPGGSLDAFALAPRLVNFARPLRRRSSHYGVHNSHARNNTCRFCACRFVPLSHEVSARAGPPTSALLHEIAESAASPGAVPTKVFMENAMRNLSTARCRGIARQVLAPAPLQARLDGRPVLPGRPVSTDSLA